MSQAHYVRIGDAHTPPPPPDSEVLADIRANRVFEVNLRLDDGRLVVLEHVVLDTLPKGETVNQRLFAQAAIHNGQIIGIARVRGGFNLHPVGTIWSDGVDKIRS